MSDANYGVLRQGLHSTMRSATIRHGRFANMFGDGVEWNMCPNDAGILISDIEIDRIDDKQGHLFWGLGIGLAGADYVPDWNRAVSVKDFQISNIRGRRMRQLVNI